MHRLLECSAPLFLRQPKIFHLCVSQNLRFGFPTSWQADRGLHPQPGLAQGTKAALLVELRVEAPAGSKGVWPRLALAGDFWQLQVPGGSTEGEQPSQQQS